MIIYSAIQSGMIVVFFKAAFIFQRKREDANYSVLIIVTTVGYFETSFTRKI